MKWISVKDRLPDSNLDEECDVLCWSSKFGKIGDDATNGYHVILWYNGTHWVDDNDVCYEDNPDYHRITHWMKLPEEPGTIKSTLSEDSQLPKPPLSKMITQGVWVFCDKCDSTMSKSGWGGLFGKRYCDNNQCTNSKEMIFENSQKAYKYWSDITRV
jgi:hypothetical protein